MENDLKALIDRVRELRAQLEACGPEERSRRIGIILDLEDIYDRFRKGFKEK